MEPTYILVVDDDPNARESLEELLRSEGHRVITAGSGAEAISLLRSEMPHLVVLDLFMQDMSGLEVSKRMRQDVRLSHIPIILLTGRGTPEDEITSLKQGCDEYIEKPIKPREFLAKIESIIKRTLFELDSNPLTHLPGNNSIHKEIKRRMESGHLFAVCYLDLDNFKPFNDRYGFEAGDDVIRLAANCIIEAVHESNPPDTFIGHIGGDDFTIVTRPDSVDPILTRVIQLFDSRIHTLYSEEDKARGFIVAKDRRGRTHRFPIMSLSAGVVTNKERDFTHPGEVTKIVAELKQYAKGLPGSNYVVDKRRQGKRERRKIIIAARPEGRILIVEPDLDLSNDLCRILKDNGYETCQVRDRASCLSRLSRSPFDLVLIDEEVPGGRGIDLIREIEDGGPDVLTLLITANNQDILWSLRLGAVGFIEKTFYCAEDVKEVVEKALLHLRIIRCRRLSIAHLREERRRVDKTMGVLITLSILPESKIHFRWGHSRRVADLAVLVMEGLGVMGEERDDLYYGPFT